MHSDFIDVVWTNDVFNTQQFLPVNWTQLLPIETQNTSIEPILILYSIFKEVHTCLLQLYVLYHSNRVRIFLLLLMMSSCVSKLMRTYMFSFQWWNVIYIFWSEEKTWWPDKWIKCGYGNGNYVLKVKRTRERTAFFDSV